MPPSAPAGLPIPLWAYIMAFVVAALAPALSIFLTWHLKDKRAAKAQEGQALVDDQATFIDKILKAAEMAPKLLEANEKLIEANADHKAQITLLTDRIKELESKVAGLEKDKEAWQVMAQRVPHLEGQLELSERLLREKMAELEAARRENETLTRRLVDAQAFGLTRVGNQE